MNDNSLLDRLEATQRRLTALCAALAHADPRDQLTPLDRMRESLRGQPGAASYDADQVSGGAPSSSTERAALGKDPARDDRRQLDRHVTALLDYVVAAEHLVAAWMPRTPAPRDLEATNRAPDGCASCARILDGQKRPHWEPPYTKNPSTVAGNLAEPKLLCEWCHKYVSQHGSIPTRAAVEKHLADPRRERVRIDPREVA